MTAKLIISIDDEQFQETEIELVDDGQFQNLNPELADYILESRCKINERKVRQVIARSINDSPLKYALGKSWEAVLMVGSRMNEIESFENQICQKDLPTQRNGKSHL